jgi:hypothetical protein
MLCAPGEQAKEQGRPMNTNFPPLNLPSAVSPLFPSFPSVQNASALNSVDQLRAKVGLLEAAEPLNFSAPYCNTLPVAERCPAIPYAPQNSRQPTSKI